MNIVNKIVRGNDVVGYRIDDEGLLICMCNRCLYVESYLTKLVAEGYQYYSYDANDIIDPNGNPITQLPEIDFNSFDDGQMLEWGASEEATPLTDVQASRYYSYRDTSTLSFKQEESYEINTREELIAYLNSIKRAITNASFCVDNRPLNSFVNPDALFKLEELDNGDILGYFDIIVKRHHFKDYNGYLWLIDYLYNKGVLNNKKPTVSEFLSAYYAWGPEGLNCKCIDFKLKLAVDGSFVFASDPLMTNSSGQTFTSNRVMHSGIVDLMNNIRYIRETINLNTINDAADFGRNILAIEDKSLIDKIKLRNREALSKTPSPKKYSVVDYMQIADISDRLYFTLINDNGFRYIYKVSHDKIKIGLADTDTNQTNYIAYNNFGFATIIHGITIPLTAVRSDDDYFLWNVATLKAVTEMNKKRKDVPYKSTSEFLLDDGVSPISVINKMAKSADLSHAYDFNSPMAYMVDALSAYCGEIDDDILKAFMIDPRDLEYGIESFIEMADVDDLLDRRDKMMSSQINPNDDGYDPTFRDANSKHGRMEMQMDEAMRSYGHRTAEDAIDFYTKVKFVHDCLEGLITLNNFNVGKKLDGVDSYVEIVNIILSVVYAECGDNPNRDQAKNVILNISDYIDTDVSIPNRDNAWKGYMIDFAEHRRDRASETCTYWMYCTKVFRELANAPVEDQRHYMMEVVVLGCGDKNDSPAFSGDLELRRSMRDIVHESLQNAKLSTKKFYGSTGWSDWNQAKIAEASEYYVAAKLFFHILGGGVKTDPVDGYYIVPMVVQDGISVDIKVPVADYNKVKQFNVKAHKRYISLYDFCWYEYDTATYDGNARFYLVNASVDPWHVKPKLGYTIKSYPFMLNYYKASTIDSSYGDGYYQSQCNNGVIISHTNKALETLDWDEFIPSIPCASAAERTHQVPNSVEMAYKTYNSDIRARMKNAEALKAKGTYSDKQLLDEYEECLYDVECYYGLMADQKYEPVYAYVLRWSICKKIARLTGKNLVTMPMKQDICWNAIANHYFDDQHLPSTVATFSEVKPVLTVKNDTNVEALRWSNDTANFGGYLTTSAAKYNIERFTANYINDGNIDILSDIISGSRKPAVLAAVSGNFIVIPSTNGKYLVTQLTDDDLQYLIGVGIAYEISTGKYFIDAMNGNFIMEANT